MGTASCSLSSINLPVRLEGPILVMIIIFQLIKQPFDCYYVNDLLLIHYKTHNGLQEPYGSPHAVSHMHPLAPLTDQEVEELVSDLLEVESKAAEAQESLEKESLARVEAEVRAELAESLHADDLDEAVSAEMRTFVEEWEATLDELETESAHLLEQLDGAGIDLPSLYKWIESQAPCSCSTEAWRKRTHWVGSQLTTELSESIIGAEKYLQSQRPVRRKHGKLLEEGASGFLGRKLCNGNCTDVATENTEKDWSSFNEIIQSHKDENSFGGKHWASVYLASTPQQAANLGLKLPGVDEVEEIDDIEASSKQKKNFRKLEIKNEMWNLIRHKQEVDLETMNGASLLCRSPSDVEETRGKKHSLDNEEVDNEKKRSRTVIIESDDEAQVVNEEPSSYTSIDTNSKMKPTVQAREEADSMAINSPSLHRFPEKYHCTACSKVVGACEIQQHPLLKVIICESCKSIIEEKMLEKDPDCCECYCGWCGRSSDLINCRTCKMLFCAPCIKYNFGEEYLSTCQNSGWQCCCCSPILLRRLTLECEEALAAEDASVSTSDSDSELSDADIRSKISVKKRRKKKIRRILDDAELGEETKQKIAIEKARQEHLISLQKQFTTESWSKNPASCLNTAVEGASTEVLGDATTGYIVNVVREKDEDAVRIPPSISAKLKPHQISGIRFMWENIIQSVRKVKSGDKGLGCILAHTMGLGKTFQVIAFLYASMRSVDLGLKCALIVTPVNVLHNWRKEFMKWRPIEMKQLRVFMLEDASSSEKRLDLLTKWRRKGGVLLIGYASFRNLSLGKHVKDRHVAREICYALQDGPDILVCDEAHMIKNTRADTTQALKQVKCQRRIALTGSPLQNNLMEYYCMVDFVREGFLGSSHEFRNRFQNPIENGQHANSTSNDVKIMNQRSHILHEQLKGFVQRMDMNVVKKDLPPKTVYVIAVKLSSLQRKLYKKFLDVHGFTSGKISGEKFIGRRCFFAGYQALAQIWNHPGLLQMGKEHRDHLTREDAVESFLVDVSSSDDELEREMQVGEKQRIKNDLPQKRNDNGFLHELRMNAILVLESAYIVSSFMDWWNNLLHEKNYKVVDHSGKMVLLLEILSMSASVGDKALIFSQSLLTLDLIELYLSRLPRIGKQGKCWRRGKEWYRLDGSTKGSERQELVEKFNDPFNKRVKCTLISTRAGSLGINLHAANRVIIVDGSWNPTYDLQAIYRVWRYGQRKPVYAYRLMAYGTMEEKIYKRQVIKEGLSARVVDKQQIHRHMSKEEMLHLFDFGDEENADIMLGMATENESVTNLDNTIQSATSLKEKLPNGGCSSDKIMEHILGKHRPRWIVNFHEHETLLQENEDEKLSKEEQDMAWEIFRRSIEWEEVQRVPVDGSTQERKPPVVNIDPIPPETNHSTPPKGILRNRIVQRKCTNLAHLLTLRSQGTKVGCSTVCGECAQEISWESLSKDGKSTR
ncbi:hypothetical protein Scep_029459 [Stephania cephalantha]|uniref:ATP-dependent helicase ATRX n=1 Tax=Stephania cephalantha TaxID=152367 RepID=A0AAP0E5F0_9MAGN